MATIADQLIGSVMQTSQQAPDISGAINKGAELGLHMQQVQQQREVLEQKKQELQQQKLLKFGDDVSKIHEFKDANARNGYIKFLKAQNQQLGLKIPDDALEFAFAGPENIARVGTLQTMVQNGDMSGPDAISVLQDPSKFAKIVPKSKYLDTFSGPNAGIDLAEASDKIAKANAERNANIAQMTRGGAYQEQADTRKNEQAAQAVNRINTDHILSGLTTQHNAVTKGKDILSAGPGNVSWKMANEVLQDLSSALNPKGGGSDFKLKEFTSPSAAQTLADVASYIDADPNKPASDATIKFLNDMANRLSDTYKNQIKARGIQLKKELSDTYTKNPDAVKAAAGAADPYVNGTWSGGEPTYNVFGHNVNADQAKAFYKAHPEIKPDPQMKKALGL